jgi:hypothetical protein
MNNQTKKIDEYEQSPRAETQLEIVHTENESERERRPEPAPKRRGCATRLRAPKRPTRRGW